MAQEETTHPLYHRLSDFFFQDISEKGVVTRNVFYFVRIIGYLVKEFAKDSCPQRAAALAYTSVLSLVPVTALFVLYFKVAGKLDALSGRAQEWVLSTFVAESAQSATVYLDQFVKNIHTKALGTLGALGLVVSAYLLFRTIERSLNDIWKVRTHRSIIERFKILSAVLISVPALLVASFYISGRFQEIKLLGTVSSLTTAMRTVFVAAPFLLTVIPFVLIFKFLPNTFVRWKAALTSAIFASILFELAKSGFNYYVVNIIHINRIYGTLGLIPVLLLWIYFSWIIILLGVELSYCIQNYRVLHDEALQKRTKGPLDIALHEEWGLRIAIALIRRFRLGEGPVSKEEIASDLGLKIPHVEDHLLTLMKAQYVVSASGDDPGFLFCRPIENITDIELFNIFRLDLGLPLISRPGQEKKLIDLLG